MLIQVVTTWEGSPAGLEKIVEGSKQAGPIHESMGAKNPRLWRASAGGDAEEGWGDDACHSKRQGRCRRSEPDCGQRGSRGTSEGQLDARRSPERCGI